MKQSFTLENLQALLFFPFKGPGGNKKLAIGSLITFASFIIPILPSLFLLGYAGLIMRQIIIEKKEPQMPEWQNWNEMLALGAKLFGVSFIYSFPIIIVMILGYLAMMLPVFMTGFSESGELPPGFESVMLIGMFGGMAAFGISMLLSLLLWAILPPALSHTAAKGSFSAGFRVREWWNIFRANIGGFIVAMILAGGIYMLLIVAMQIIYMTIILCFLLPFLFSFVTAYLTIIIFTLFAQAYSEGVAKTELQAG